MADNEQIVFLKNYFHKFDPQNYYKNDISLENIRAKPYLPVYVSDLINNNDCDIIFGKYRNKDDDSSIPIMKNSEFRTGVAHSYNPKTKLLEVISEKKKPFIKRFNKKMRYIEPERATLNLSGKCKITKTNCEQKPECLKQLNDLVQEYQKSKTLSKTQNGRGRRSKRNIK